MSHNSVARHRRMAILAVLFMAASSLLLARPQPNPAGDALRPGRLYFEVRLERHWKTRSLKPGDVVEGELLRDVYAGDREVFPAGTRVGLKVSGFEIRRREPNGHLPGVIRFFTPRHEKCPGFQSATLLMQNGVKVTLPADLVAISRKVEIHARVKMKGKNAARPAAQAASPSPRTAEAGSKAAKTRSAGKEPLLVLEATIPSGSPLMEAFARSDGGTLQAPVTLAAGTRARAVLLNSLWASHSHVGDSFQALLLEPVRQSGKIVMPEGTLVDGTVLKSTPPRWLSRPGSLRIGFTKLELPSGESGTITASLAGAEVDARARPTIDSEGVLSGGRPGKAWMLINFGVSAGIAKETDDAEQLIAEAIISTATDASTAGVARIVAACTSTAFAVTRHGRDVILPRDTEMEIVLDRPLTLLPSREDSASIAVRPLEPNACGANDEFSHREISSAARQPCAVIRANTKPILGE